ncbi:disease resistance protein RGA2-like [Aristolochia californica]|uniref:disease resistance protein RGA2-like n=1 Tax=Aristolochia californica TaxID=171875 RepID=UPI0035E2B2DC
MAEIVLSPLLERVIGSLGSALGEEIKLVWGVEEELQRLSSMLSHINSLMAYTEERQQESNITDWLRKLKDAVYDAENVIDDFNLKALQAKQVGDVVESKIRKEVHNLCFCFSLKKVAFRREIGNRIQGIWKRLDDIAKEYTQVHLLEMSVARPIQIREGPDTSPLIDPSTVIGREEEKDKLIKELLGSNESNSGKHFSVIPIQGLGGLGKTTLARLVYDNEEVKKHFEVRGWVCASDKFERRRVTKEIVESITGNPCEVTQPEVLLKNLIDGKRFLIVIDDVWEDALKYWDDFYIPFIHENQGSKLIVTTRSENVSSVMGTYASFRLANLPYEDCLKLFLRKACVNDHEERYPNLVKIGKDIVKKCGGVPLAINTLGGLLKSTRKESDWNGVLKSSFWKLPQNEDSILPALRLSYYHLPPKVKPCFAFCSLFPKDWRFDKDELIRMWIALGYIQPDGRREEEVGDEYFNDLHMRSFFSDNPYYENEYTMHDLVHDLAESLGKEECIRLHDGKLDLIPEKNNIPQRGRHASLILSGNAEQASFDDIKSLRRLRTFVALTNISSVDNNSVEFNLIDTIEELKFLHIMRLRRGMINRVPNVIGCFPLLRYLDLSHTQIEELPDSFCNLSYLQTLNLRGCYKLKKLPNNTVTLKNLRYLNISACTRLTSMPSHIGKLTNLRELTRFIVGKKARKKIVELKGLNSLKGVLDIEGLENVVDGEEAKEAGLKNKQLRKLSLEWAWGDPQDGSIDEDVLENLHPHINLEALCLIRYVGTSLPSWLSNLPSLQEMQLSSCWKLKVVVEELS